MTCIHRLAPPLRVMTPKGEGFAHAWIDYGPELNTIWKVALFGSSPATTGEVINVDDEEIRMCGNAMWNMDEPEQPKRTI